MLLFSVADTKGKVFFLLFKTLGEQFVELLLNKTTFYILIHSTVLYTRRPLVILQ